MNTEIIFNVTESSEVGYGARAIGHSIFTECESYAELGEVLRDSVKCHFEEQDMPKLIRIHFVKDEVLAV